VGKSSRISTSTFWLKSIPAKRGKPDATQVAEASRIRLRRGVISFGQLRPGALEFAVHCRLWWPLHLTSPYTPMTAFMGDGEAKGKTIGVQPSDAIGLYAVFAPILQIAATCPSSARADPATT
jgi:hypothetical protein